MWQCWILPHLSKRGRIPSSVHREKTGYCQSLLHSFHLQRKWNTLEGSKTPDSSLHRTQRIFLSPSRGCCPLPCSDHPPPDSYPWPPTTSPGLAMPCLSSKQERKWQSKEPVCPRDLTFGVLQDAESTSSPRQPLHRLWVADVFKLSTEYRNIKISKQKHVHVAYSSKTTHCAAWWSAAKKYAREQGRREI